MPLPIVAGAFWAYRGYKTYKTAKKLKKAYDAAQKLKKTRAAAKKLSKTKKKKCKNCKKDPCKHLKKGSAGAKHRGGSYGQTKGTLAEKTESHHIPPKSSYPAGSMRESQMPAIRMDKIDHDNTKSHGSKGLKGQAYRNKAAQNIKNGDFRKALADDVKDVRRIAREAGDPKKYNKALKETLEYQKCLEKHGLLPKG